MTLPVSMTGCVRSSVSGISVIWKQVKSLPPTPTRGGGVLVSLVSTLSLPWSPTLTDLLHTRHMTRVKSVATTTAIITKTRTPTTSSVGVAVGVASATSSVGVAVGVASATSSVGVAVGVAEDGAGPAVEEGG